MNTPTETITPEEATTVTFLTDKTTELSARYKRQVRVSFNCTDPKDRFWAITSDGTGQHGFGATFGEALDKYALVVTQTSAVAAELRHKAELLIAEAAKLEGAQ
jgi:hypothetical protein